MEVELLWPGLLLVLALGALILAYACAARWPSFFQLGTWRPDRQAAQERAETLLRELLSADEYRQLADRGYLEVPSPSHPHRVYRIPREQRQVGVYDHGVLTAKLCLQPVEPIPDGDVVLLHKLMIEGNEREYLHTANHFLPRRPLGPRLDSAIR